MQEKTVEEKTASQKAGGKVEVKKKEPQAESKGRRRPAETVYTAGELAASAKNVFGARRECVEAALEAAGKQECAVSEAKRIVENFLKKEVG